MRREDEGVLHTVVVCDARGSSLERRAAAVVEEAHFRLELDLCDTEWATRGRAAKVEHGEIMAKRGMVIRAQVAS